MVTARPIINLDDPAVRDLQIEALVTEIRSLTEGIEDLESRIAAKKQTLRTLLEQRGEQWTDETGYARIVADHTRTSYDAKALDALQLASPWWHKRLNKYRRTFPVRGGLQVK